jgi:hypothetical protein
MIDAEIFNLNVNVLHKLYNYNWLCLPSRNLKKNKFFDWTSISLQKMYLLKVVSPDNDFQAEINDFKTKNFTCKYLD